MEGQENGGTFSFEFCRSSERKLQTDNSRVESHAITVTKYQSLQQSSSTAEDENEISKALYSLCCAGSGSSEKGRVPEAREPSKVSSSVT